MWAWGVDQHVRFWSRRQLHETLVHRIDLELAMGDSRYVEPSVALDAIDELVQNLKAAAQFSPRVREIRGSGEILTIRDDDGSARWTVRLERDGFSLVGADGHSDVEVCGSSRDLLLVIYRRTSLRLSNVRVTGNRTVFEHWLANSALE
jgi:hypothetical protein